MDPSLRTKLLVGGRAAGSFAAVLAFAALASAEPCLRFEACVDGSEYLHLQGASLQVEHRNWTPLGRHSDCTAWGTLPVAALVNGEDWQPVWSAGFCTGCFTDAHELLPPMPMEESIELVQLAGDGVVSVVQFPTLANGFKTVLLLDDDGHGGATWFSLELWCGCRPPTEPEVAVTETPCQPGNALSWEPVDFPGPSATGWYNVFRSETSCLHALEQPPLVTGLLDPRFTDETASPFVATYYVVEAEGSGAAPAGCEVGSRQGGPAARGCLAGAVDTHVEPVLTQVGNTLRPGSSRAAHASFRWDAATGLVSGESWAVFRALTPQGDFLNLTPPGFLAPRFEDLDDEGVFFVYDVRVTDACGVVSED